MQKDAKIAYLSEFYVERNPISIGGMSEKVFRGYMNGHTYFIKYGSLSEVIAEKIFNDMAAYCNVADNEVIIIINDLMEGDIDSPFVVATKMVDGEEWQYNESAPMEVLRDYAVFIAIKIFLVDDDSPEFILSKDNTLYSIDNSISGFSNMFLEILNGQDIVVKKIGIEKYEMYKKHAFENISRADALMCMSQNLFTEIKIRFDACGLAKYFIDALYKLSEIGDETIEKMTTGMRLLYSNDAIDCVNQQIKAFRKNVKTLIESEVKNV